MTTLTFLLVLKLLVSAFATRFAIQAYIRYSLKKQLTVIQTDNSPNIRLTPTSGGIIFLIGIIVATISNFSDWNTLVIPGALLLISIH